MGRRDQELDFDPSNQRLVELYLKVCSDELPPVCAPTDGYPLSMVGVWPGDVLTTSRSIYLVVDVSNDDAICYTVGDRRYSTYAEENINRDLSDDRVYYHEEIVEIDRILQ